jgi:hypothetical protein
MPAILAIMVAAVLLTASAIRWPSYVGPQASSISFMAAGFVMSAALLFLPAIRPRPTVLQSREPWAIVAVACGMVISYQLSARIMDASPLDYRDADMLPIMQAMARRFLAGDWASVYDVIPGIWSGIQPIYLPLLWMPFAAAEVFHFDPRWVTVSGIWVAACVAIVFIDLRKGLLGWLLLCLLYLVMHHLHMEPSNNVIRLTEEGVIYAWYALLAWALFSRNDLFLSLALSCCLLSRFSLAGAVPAMLLYRALQGRWRSLLVTASIPSLLCAFMLLAFGIRTLMPFTSLPAKYIGHAQWVWRTHPEYMTEGLGLAKFFGPGRVALQHSLLTWSAIILPSSAALAVWMFGRLRRKPLENVDAALVTLALTFFHAFVPVTYDYLFFTPVFFGLAVAAIVQSHPTEAA